jgi:hypothetical protein
VQIYLQRQNVTLHLASENFYNTTCLRNKYGVPWMLVLMEQLLGLSGDTFFQVVTKSQN